MANTKSLNDLFDRRAMVSARPDDTWPLSADYVGVEIEVEDYDGDQFALRPEWLVHVDHSLRNGVEFVTASPIGGQQLTAALNKFFDSSHTYEISPRTSVHIHLNASDNMSVEQFRNMIVLMYVIEPAVFRWADENRKWCGYCAPLTDIAPQRFVTILNENDNDSSLVNAIRGENNRDRYYGFNIAAYNKHGTVEFRYFPCTRDKEQLIKWIKFAMMVKRTALQNESVPAMLTSMEGEFNLRAFIEANFGEIADHIINNLDMLDANNRVTELLSSVHLKPVPLLRKMAAHSTASPLIRKLLAKQWPDRADLLESKAVTEPSTADELFARLLAETNSSYEALMTTTSVFDASAAVAAMNRHNAVRVAEERAQPRMEVQQRESVVERHQRGIRERMEQAVGGTSQQLRRPERLSGVRYVRYEDLFNETPWPTVTPPSTPEDE